MGCFFMIILTKKKIVYVAGLILMFLFAFMVAEYSVKNSNKDEVNVVETVALPVNNKTIVLDAGHGVPDERC